jgi:prophage DNA circulation protein
VSAATDAFAQASAALASAVLAATNDPADAVRLLLPLTAWTPTPLPRSGPLAQLARAAQDAIADNLRCAACAALGEATLAYRPTSYQEAQALRRAVCDALDRQATRCADAGRDASYAALRELRAAVALDLAVRGANLAWLVEVETAQPMPALAEAWTLYTDTTREPALVAAADVRHPLFLPVSFTALSR